MFYIGNDRYIYVSPILAKFTGREIGTLVKLDPPHVTRALKEKLDKDDSKGGRA